MAGIYIHIPFCKKKCTYCDFHFSTTFSNYRDKMIACICREIEIRHTYLSGETLETIYFGGGTPSLLTPAELNQILETIKANFQIVAHPEITLEANPDDLSEIQLQNYKKLGINRLSIGLQSFDDEQLNWMNRAHSAKESIACIHLAQSAGFSNISIDLIYGLPNLTNEQWRKTIQKAIELNVKHISAYCLTVEDKTALHKWVDSGKIRLPDDDLQSEQFEILVDTLESAGIKQYEISNFAYESFESKHNSSYWKGVKYLGIGPSAHSFNGGTRSWNISNNLAYIKGIESDSSFFETEILSKKDVFNEYLLTGLRMVTGINLTTLSNIIEITDSFQEKIDQFIQMNWLERSEGQICLTKEGKLKADYIASELFI